MGKEGRGGSCCCRTRAGQPEEGGGAACTPYRLALTLARYLVVRGSFFVFLAVILPRPPSISNVCGWTRATQANETGALDLTSQEGVPYLECRVAA